MRKLIGKSVICLSAVLCLAAMSGCGKQASVGTEGASVVAAEGDSQSKDAEKDTEKDGEKDSLKNTGAGTREEPLSAGQTGFYDGISSDKESRQFQAELVLEDAVRGDLAMEIFKQANGREEISTDIVPEGKELILAKFTAHVTKQPASGPAGFASADISMFDLVSESGVQYDEFITGRFVEQNMFQDLYEGGTQTGNLFFLVDKADENPLIVFYTKVNGGLWFDTNVSPEERGENPITLEEWKVSEPVLDYEAAMDAQKNYTAEKEKYAGNLSAPLPLGEWGYMKSALEETEPEFIEMRAVEAFRGEEAVKIWKKYRFQMEERELTGEEDILIVRMQLNVLTLPPEENNYYISGSNFTLVNGKRSVEYGSDAAQLLQYRSPEQVYVPGTTEFILAYIVEKEDENPILSYDNYSDSLWFNLSGDGKLPEGRISYEPVFREEMLRDKKAILGTSQNPIPLGQEGYVRWSYDDSSEKELVEAKITVLESVRGKDAEIYLDHNLEELKNRREELDLELVAVKLRVKVEKLEGKDAPQFGSSSFVYMGRDNAYINVDACSEFEVKEGLDKVYPGSEVTGYLAFYVPKDVEEINISYNPSGFDNENLWMNIITP